MSPFERATTLKTVAAGRFSVEVPDGWQQGRGAFGGLVLGTLLRAIEACEPDPLRRTRALVGDLVGPVQPGESEVVVTVLRRGSNQTNLRADLLQGGEVVAHATVVSSKPRPDDLAFPVTPPSRPDWAAVAPLPDFEVGPKFSRFYEYRNTGPIPFSSGTEAFAAGFVREKEVPSRVDAPALVALLDVWWPAMFTPANRPRAGATVSFTAEILCDPSTIDPATPLFVTCRAVAGHQGFIVEFRELWDGDRLVALNQQTFAVLS